MQCTVRMLTLSVSGRIAGAAFNKTTGSIPASHDGIGLNPLRGILPESEILALVEKLQQEGALVNWKIILTVRAVLTKLM